MSSPGLSSRRFKSDHAANRPVFDAPIDAWYTWLGVAVVSLLAFGTVASLPTAPPPDAVSAADAVDRTAASQHAATAEIPVDADQLRLGRHQVGLRNDAGTAHASFAYGPVTPVSDDSRLEAVLRGAAPSQEFDSAADLRAASAATDADRSRWRPSDGLLLVRRVSWDGVDVTLVGQR